MRLRWPGWYWGSDWGHGFTRTASYPSKPMVAFSSLAREATSSGCSI